MCLTHTEDEFHGRMKIVQPLIECLQHTESYRGFCLVVFMFRMSTNQFKCLERNEKKFYVKSLKYLQRISKISKISISFSENAVVRSVKQEVLVKSKFS